MDIQELKLTLSDLNERLNDIKINVYKIDSKKTRLQEIESQLSQEKVWSNLELSQKLSKEKTALEKAISSYDNVSARLSDCQVLLDVSVEENDDSSFQEIFDETLKLNDLVEDLEFSRLFTNKMDSSSAYVEIQAGSGGTEAQDWAEMLLRMYQRWAEQKGLSFEVTAVSEGTEAGISSAEFIVTGRRAYGMLQSEHGVHRLVRISPFNKQANRHTSFASMHVVPFFEEVPDQIDIEETELRIDTYRSSGAGGQHVNVTDSAVRITHLPSGVVVSCQNERSQHQNKEKCMQMLASKLHDLERQQREDEIASIRGENKNVGFGSQIRSYVMQPYQMVKDLRTNFEIGAVENVLNGHIDPFIESYLRWVRSESNEI